LPGFVVSRHAQRRFGAKGEFYDRLCGHDDLVVERVIGLMTTDPEERRRLHERVEREAEEFVRRYWCDIEKLAYELFERGSLNRDEIASVLGPPKRSEDEGLLDGVPFRRRNDGYISPAPCIDARTIGSYHEAGHAVVAAALNQTVTKLSVNSDGTGYCNVRYPSTTGNRREILHYCAVASGGGVAASRLTGENRWGVQDHRNIENALAELSTREAVQVLHDARALAARIIAENWGSVCTLARRLHSRGEMNGTDVINLLPELRTAA
jgi:hypothetical protein